LRSVVFIFNLQLTFCEKKPRNICISISDCFHLPNNFQMNMEYKLSIVMPCLDEARTVGICTGKALGFLARYGVTGEVVVADNGSRDFGKNNLSARSSLFV
jgi:hypothetical protein